jgi:hypothetical protein
MHNQNSTRFLNSKKHGLSIFSIVLIAQINLSCSKSEPDEQTLHFTTRDNIKTSLDLDIEMYIADNDPNLFYINYKYYKKNKSGQWAVSHKPGGPWKVFPDQAMAPKSLLLLK